MWLGKSAINPEYGLFKLQQKTQSGVSDKGMPRINRSELRTELLATDTRGRNRDWEESGKWNG